jgi:hypothetical protein
LFANRRYSSVILISDRIAYLHREPKLQRGNSSTKTCRYAIQRKFIGRLGNSTLNFTRKTDILATSGLARGNASDNSGQQILSENQNGR